MIQEEQDGPEGNKDIQKGKTKIRSKHLQIHERQTSLSANQSPILHPPSHPLIHQAR